MFLTRDDRVALQRDQWEREAVALLMARGKSETEAWRLAFILYRENKDEGGEMMETPEEAVRQEYEYS